MINKIIGSVTITIAVLCILISISIFNKEPGLSISLFIGSLFTILVGIVIFRHGLKGAAKAYGDGIPRSLR